MRRWILPTILLLGYLITAPPATAAVAADCKDLKPNFSEYLTCWKKESAPGAPAPAPAPTPTRVSIEGPITLDNLGKVEDLETAIEQFRNGALEVSVPGKAATGKGGTVLLLLVPAPQRRISSDVKITRLDQQSVKKLTDARLCDALCEMVAGTKDASGKDLTDAKGKDLLDQELATKLDEGGGGPFGGTFTYVLIAVLAAGLLAIAFLVVRRSPTPRPAGGPSIGPLPSPPVRPTQPSRVPRPVRHLSHQAAPASGPRVTAVLRTDLHPQGYVELDNCLFRAAWCDAEVPPPALGEPVDVVKGTGRDADLLLAYPPGTGR